MRARLQAPRGKADWPEIRRRMEAVGRELGGASERSPEVIRTILMERARKLARPPAAPPKGERIEAVTFGLADEVFAIDSRLVLQVFRLVDLDPLPGAEPPVFGVTTWRGDLLTILDLRSVLGLPVAALNDLSRVLVLGSGRPAFGVLADAVHEIVELPVSRLLPPSAAAARRDYVRGVTSEAVQLLDGPRLLRLIEPDPI